MLKTFHVSVFRLQFSKMSPQLQSHLSFMSLPYDWFKKEKDLTSKTMTFSALEVFFFSIPIFHPHSVNKGAPRRSGALAVWKGAITSVGGASSRADNRAQASQRCYRCFSWHISVQNHKSWYSREQISLSWFQKLRCNKIKCNC